MTASDFVQNTRRKLPHIQLPDSVLFITWRLAFTLPKYIKDKAEDDESYLDSFSQYDSLLDKSESAEINISCEPYLSIIKQAIHHYAGERYELYAFCIMPNHVHLVVKPKLKDTTQYFSLKKITLAIKSYTAHAIKKLNKQMDKVWQTESYDHVVRDETELLKILEYVITNPVRAGLADTWECWEGTHISKEFM